MQNPGDVEEQGPPCVSKSQACSGCRKWLAWEPRDEQVKTWQRGRFDLLDVPEGSVGEVLVISFQGPLVNFSVTNALEVATQFLAGGLNPQLKAAIIMTEIAAIRIIFMVVKRATCMPRQL